MSNIYMKSCDIYNDTCWMEAKDHRNTQIDNYNHYNTNFVDCKNPNIRMPSFYLDHVNLTAAPHPNVANHPDDCLIDNESGLKINRDKQTRDRCNIQLYHRMFQACPNLRPGVGDPSKELDVLAGNDTTHIDNKCTNNIMEKQTYQFIPMLDCVKSVQDPEHVVESWTRGGSATRDFVNRREFLKKCGNFSQRQGTWVA